MEKKTENNRGLLLVVSGPSGAGKGTLCGLLRKALPNLAYSVSVTTREPREGEVDGKDYFFKTVPEVKDMIFRGEFLEYAQVYGNYYGTPKPYVMSLLGEGRDVLLEIDIQGALQIKKVFPDAVLVFIIPPTLDELRARLYKRGKDTEEVIEKRLKESTRELRIAAKYDYIIINDDIEKACGHMLSLLDAERYRSQRMDFVIDRMLDNASGK